MRPIRLAFSTLATAALSVAALAGNGAPDAGSLLVFPVMDNTGANVTLITVTNTNSNMVPIGGTLFGGSVDVHFILVNGTTDQGNFLCEQADFNRILTPNDTLTINTDSQALLWDRGYVYVYARSPTTGAAIAWNYLIGSSAVISPTDYYELNPFVFKSGRGQVEGANLDPTPGDDTTRDFNGGEYERVFDRIQVPHFWGEQDEVPVVGGGTLPLAQSDLVLINVTGAGQFTVIANFLLYNDNENEYSAQTSFRCWTRRRLNSISGMFNNSFLDMVSDNAEIHFGLESGWYRINGGTGSSGFDGLTNAGILAVQIGSFRGETTANLPFTSGINPNDGELLSLENVHN